MFGPEIVDNYLFQIFGVNSLGFLVWERAFYGRTERLAKALTLLAQSNTAKNVPKSSTVTVGCKSIINFTNTVFFACCSFSSRLSLNYTDWLYLLLLLTGYIDFFHYAKHNSVLFSVKTLTNTITLVWIKLKGVAGWHYLFF